MRISVRWALALGLATSLLLLGVAVLLGTSLRTQEKEETKRWSQARQQALDERLLSLAQGANAATSDLLVDGELRALLAQALESDGLGDRRVVEWAALQAPRYGLDDLLVLDQEGRVVSSSLWTASYGQLHPSRAWLETVPEGVILMFPGWAPRDAPWQLGVVQELRLRGQRFLTIGAMRLDERRLANTAILAGLRSLEVAGSQPADLQWRPPQEWWMQEDFALAAVLGEAPALDSLGAVRRRLVSIALLALGATLLTAPLVAGGLARPLVRLARAVTELGQGARNLDLPRGGPREVRELARAVEGLAQDLDEAQARMRAAERRAAWRDVARRIAHELKNALSPLTLAMDNVETAVQRDDPAARRALAASLSAARDQLASLDRLVTEFRSFARAPRLELSPTDAVGVCASALASAREAKPDCGFQMHEDGGLGGLHADGEQLRRAIHNLLINAAEAAPGGDVELTVGPGPGVDRWSLSVLDRGPGLAPEVAARLGEPYLTTKESGTGLGLAIVIQVIEGHGGRLEARPRPGGGQEMRVSMPRFPATPAEDPLEDEL